MVGAVCGGVVVVVVVVVSAAMDGTQCDDASIATRFLQPGVLAASWLRSPIPAGHPCRRV